MKTKITRSPAGLVVEAATLGEAFAALLEDPLASLDMGPLRISGERRPSGKCTLEVRLFERRIPYSPTGKED